MYGVNISTSPTLLGPLNVGEWGRQDLHRCSKRSLLDYKLPSPGYLADQSLLASRHRAVYPLPGHRDFLFKPFVKASD